MLVRKVTRVMTWTEVEPARCRRISFQVQPKCWDHPNGESLFTREVAVTHPLRLALLAATDS